jgi:hypothetical protein
MKLNVAMAAISAPSRTAEDRLLDVRAATQLQRYRPRQAYTVASRNRHDCCRPEHLYQETGIVAPYVRSLGVFRMRSSNYGEAAPCSYCYREREIACPMIILVHTRESDESSAPISDGADDASQSWAPQLGFARERCGHRETRSCMPRWKRNERSIPVMKAAAKLKVLRVTVVHGRERSPGETLSQASNAGGKENRFSHVKCTTRQPRHSCQTTGRIQTCANNEGTWPAKEGEIARCVLQIVASLKAFLLEYPRSPGVERRYGNGCQHCECAGDSVIFRDPWASDTSAVAVRILRTKTGCDGCGGEGRAGGEEHMQERARIHFGIRCAM